MDRFSMPFWLASFVAILTVGGRPAPVAAAGNVEAHVVGGKLVIVGDDESNGISITSDFNTTDEDFVTISGDETTTVNGTDSFVAQNVNGKVTIKLGNGDDTLVIGETLDFPDDLAIDTGRGDDSIDLTDTRALGKLKIKMGDGDDSLSTSVAVAGKALSVSMGDGNDDYFMGDAFSAGTKGSVSMGDGNDTLFMDNLIEGKLAVNMGAGNDTVNADGMFTDRFDLSLGAGDDQFTNQADFEDDVKLNGGKGSDTLEDLGATFAAGLVTKGFEILLP